jgi:hypothetical protein
VFAKKDGKPHSVRLLLDRLDPLRRRFDRKDWKSYANTTYWDDDEADDPAGHLLNFLCDTKPGSKLT